MVNSTSVNDVLFMEIVNGFKNLFNCLRGIPLGELALVANAIKQLPSCSKLSDDIELVLQMCQSSLYLLFRLVCPHPRLEPILKFDNVRMAQCLEHLQLVVDHLFIAFNALFENDLDSTFVPLILGFSDDSVCSSS